MKHIFLFIFIPIISSVIGEFILKFTVTGLTIGLDFNSLLFLVTEPGILLGVCLIIISAVLWIVGMSKFQLSFMYPFLSINYVVIVVGSEFLLNENVDLSRYCAIILIVIGLMFISRSPYSKIKH